MTPPPDLRHRLATFDPALSHPAAATPSSTHLRTRPSRRFLSGERDPSRFHPAACSAYDWFHATKKADQLALVGHVDLDDVHRQDAPPPAEAPPTTASPGRPPVRYSPMRSYSVSLRSDHTHPTWLIIVKPPPHLPFDPPPTNVSTFSSGYGPPARFVHGALLPLHSTLSAMAGAIAREWSFPSTGGLALYLALGAGFASPRISDDTWPLLWAPFLGSPTSASGSDDDLPTSRAVADEDGDRCWTTSDGSRHRTSSSTSAFSSSSLSSPDQRQPPSSPPIWPYTYTGSTSVPVDFGLPAFAQAGLPIAGQIEFDLDPRKARWYPSWAHRAATSAAAAGPPSVFPHPHLRCEAGEEIRELERPPRGWGGKAPAASSSRGTRPLSLVSRLAGAGALSAHKNGFTSAHREETVAQRRPDRFDDRAPQHRPAPTPGDSRSKPHLPAVAVAGASDESYLSSSDLWRPNAAVDVCAKEEAYEDMFHPTNSLPRSYSRQSSFSRLPPSSPSPSPSPSPSSPFSSFPSDRQGNGHCYGEEGQGQGPWACVPIALDAVHDGHGGVEPSLTGSFDDMCHPHHPQEHRGEEVEDGGHALRLENPSNDDDRHLAVMAGFGVDTLPIRPQNVWPHEHEHGDAHKDKRGTRETDAAVGRLFGSPERQTLEDVGDDLFSDTFAVQLGRPGRSESRSASPCPESPGSPAFSFFSSSSSSAAAWSSQTTSISPGTSPASSRAFYDIHASGVSYSPLPPELHLDEAIYHAVLQSGRSVGGRLTSGTLVVEPPVEEAVPHERAGKGGRTELFDLWEDLPCFGSGSAVEALESVTAHVVPEEDCEDDSFLQPRAVHRPAARTYFDLWSSLPPAEHRPASFAPSFPADALPHPKPTRSDDDGGGGRREFFDLWSTTPAATDSPPIVVVDVPGDCIYPNLVLYAATSTSVHDSASGRRCANLESYPFSVYAIYPPVYPHSLRSIYPSFELPLAPQPPIVDDDDGEPVLSYREDRLASYPYNVYRIYPPVYPHFDLYPSTRLPEAPPRSAQAERDELVRFVRGGASTVDRSTLSHGYPHFKLYPRTDLDPAFELAPAPTRPAGVVGAREPAAAPMRFTQDVGYPLSVYRLYPFVYPHIEPYPSTAPPSAPRNPLEARRSLVDAIASYELAHFAAGAGKEGVARKRKTHEMLVVEVLEPLRMETQRAEGEEEAEGLAEQMQMEWEMALASFKSLLAARDGRSSGEQPRPDSNVWVGPDGDVGEGQAEGGDDDEHFAYPFPWALPDDGEMSVALGGTAEDGRRRDGDWTASRSVRATD